MSSDQQAIRIGDAEREQTVTELGQHMAVGRLTMSEFETRVDVVYAARTRVELNVVLADLPTAEPTPILGQAPDPVQTPRAGWMPWALTGVICLLVWVATSLAQGRPIGFWPIWVIGPWGIVILAHAIKPHHLCRPPHPTDTGGLDPGSST